MRLSVSLLLLLSTAAIASPILEPPQSSAKEPPSDSISQELFDELEELSRIVDIAYCVGTLNTGIEPPFQCLSYCRDFPTFELTKTWNTGLALTDSCGFIAISPPPNPRIIVAFRGTYSLINALADLSIAPQTYLPYPNTTCQNCTVHSGFFLSSTHALRLILPTVATLLDSYPDHQLTVVGHSLGGAVALLSALSFRAHGWRPVLTTFGEPKPGNAAFAAYVDDVFDADEYRRVTHAGDPVPLVPFRELGYAHHGHELFISRRRLPAEAADVRRCEGAEDPRCVAGGGVSVWAGLAAHRDYFHRLGVCLPMEWTGADEL